VFLKNQVALITGASSGIGYETAKAMAKEGAKVAVNYRHHPAGADAAVHEITQTGGEAFAVHADVSQQAEVDAMVKAVRERWGRVDILVNNAGAGIGRRTLQDMTGEFWDQVFAVNLKSVFFCVKAVWEEMAAKGDGCIVNINSIAARHGGSLGVAAYATAKGALLTYTKSLAKELAPKGIRVNGIAPGVIDTPLHAKTPPEIMQRFIADVPLGRVGVPSDIAGVVVFLASPSARYITGQTIDVNGGLWMD